MSTKVLYVVPSSFLLYKRLRSHILFLKSKGFEIEVASEPDQRAANAAALAGVVHHPVVLRPDISPLLAWRELKKLCAIMKGPKFDIVYSCTKKGGLLSAVAARFCGVSSVVYAVYGLNATSIGHFKQWLFFQLEKIISHFSDRVVCMSRSNLEIFSSKQICPQEKLVLIGGGSDNGVDVDHFYLSDKVRMEAVALRKAIGIPHDASVIGFVGRLDLAKGIRELSAAWEMVRAKHGSLHLLILAPPEVDPALVMTLETLKKDERVHLLGFLKDPVVGYAVMNCLVLPSYAEGFPNVILEAGAMELPVIASRVAGCVDAVIEQQTGLLVEPRSAVALAKGIEVLLEDPEKALQYGKNGRERCVRRFRRELIWQGYADLYDRLTERKRSNGSSSRGLVRMLKEIAYR